METETLINDCQEVVQSLRTLCRNLGEAGDIDLRFQAQDARDNALLILNVLIRRRNATATPPAGSAKSEDE